jgi:hypothetical protein
MGEGIMLEEETETKREAERREAYRNERGSEEEGARSGTK